MLGKRQREDSEILDKPSKKSKSYSNLLHITHPHLKEEFLYCIDRYGKKDETKTFEMLNTGSGYNVTWKCLKTNCEKGCEHIWKTTVNHRTGESSTGCPFCSKKKYVYVIRFIQNNQN